MVSPEGSADAIAWFREFSDAEPFRLESLDAMAQEWSDRTPFSTENNDVPAAYATAATSSSTGPHLQPCQNPQGSCIILATSFLKSIHAHAPTCVMGMKSDHQSQQQVYCAVDDVLSTTQRASRILRGIVQCRCHDSPQLQLLVTVICSEAIAWYRRIIATYNSGDSSATSMDGEGDNLQQENERVPLQRRPICIGKHHFDGHIEATLIGQVVSSRLQELERIIGDVAWKTSPWSQRIMGSVVGEDGGSSEMQLDRVHTRMNGFLNDQLNAARRELTSTMTISSDHNQS